MHRKIPRWIRRSIAICGSYAVAVLLGSLILLPPAAAQQAAARSNPQATQDLFKAIFAHDLAGSQAAVAAGANLATRNDWGVTPLDLAVDKGYFDIAHYLLSVRNLQRQQASEEQRSAPAIAPLLATPAAPPASPGPLPGPAQAQPARPIASNPLPRVGVVSPPPVPAPAVPRIATVPAASAPDGRPNPFAAGSVTPGTPAIIGNIQGPAVPQAARLQVAPPNPTVPQAAPAPQQPAPAPQPPSAATLAPSAATLAPRAEPVTAPSAPPPARVSEVTTTAAAAQPPAPPAVQPPPAVQLPPSPPRAVTLESPPPVTPPASPAAAPVVAPRLEPVPPPVQTVLAPPAATAAPPVAAAAAPSTKVEESPPVTGGGEGLFSGLLTKVRNLLPFDAEAREEPKVPPQAVATVVPAPATPAVAPALAPAPAQPAPPLLRNVSLRLGEEATLDRALAGERRDNCIAKREGAAVFCVEPVTWPAALRKAFDTNTIMYQGSRAIVRYDSGAATSLYAVFGVSAFDTVATWVESQFGPPTSISTQKLAEPGRTSTDNRIQIWRARDPANGKETVLELRSTDNVRNAFPDREHGILMLYREGADAIFPQLSSIDLMMLR